MCVANMFHVYVSHIYVVYCFCARKVLNAIESKKCEANMAEVCCCVSLLL